MSKRQEINKLLNKEIKIIVGSFFVVIAIVVALIFMNQNSTAQTPVVELKTDDSPLIRSYSHRMGPDSAKVKLVEFYDPECEACAAFFPHVKAIMNKFPNDVQLIVRYALYHSNSVLAAKASEAAAIQGKFWQFQELLFVKQNEWSHNHFPATMHFTKYASELKMDVEKFRRDMNDLNRMAVINTDIEDGKKLGVNATPTFFVNGKTLTNFSPEGLNEAIENELRN